MDHKEIFASLNDFVYDKIAWDYVPEAVKVLTDIGLTDACSVAASYPWSVNTKVLELIHICEDLISDHYPGSELEELHPFRDYPDCVCAEVLHLASVFQDVDSETFLPVVVIDPRIISLIQ